MVSARLGKVISALGEKKATYPVGGGLKPGGAPPKPGGGPEGKPGGGPAGNPGGGPPMGGGRP